MHYRVLGPLEVWDGDREISLGSPRRRALLAVLVTRSNEVVSSDRLADVLWSGEPPTAAANVVQGHISGLRRALGRNAIATRPGGYTLVVDSELIDLRRFERLVEEGSRALADGRAAEASEQLREALALWRGRALADVADEPLLRPDVGRLEELRLLALERRLEAELALGRHAELVGELEAFVAQNPLREGPVAHLMLALYRSGRQAEALDAYRRARQSLVDELGLEPSPMLQEVERAILRHDPALGLTPLATPSRAIVVVSLGADSPDGLLRIAGPLARRPTRELIVAAIVSDYDDLGRAAALLNERRAELLARGVTARTAALRSSAPGEDAVRLAARQEDVDLLLLTGSPSFFEEQIARTLLLEAPCDVGVLIDREDRPVGGPVLVRFAGADHDWAAVELGAWIAAGQGARLSLAGLEGVWPDASRLLASASLAVQRVVGVASEPVLVPPGLENLVA